MCGIVGILNFDQKEVDQDLIKRMSSKIAHRGPDDEGFYIKENIGLGHRRLSIIDPSPAGHQPMSNENGTIWLTYNGEVYNFKKIKLELERHGHSFKSKSDTEVVLHAYEEWGVECLNRFNGIFAFAIWDQNQQRLFLARDHLGVKPLYYYLDNQKLIFASEIKAIIENPEIKREINLKGLFNFFSYGHSLAPDTIYQKIEKLLPGYYLTAKNREVKIKQYWDIPLIGEKHDFGLKNYREKLFSLLREVVRDQLIADVPVGVFLSGGLDSSTVTAMASLSQSMPVKTFSVGFETPGKIYNELADARLVAKKFKTDHHEIIIRERNLIEILERLVYYYDEPYGDSAAVPLYLICQFASRYVKVCLSGDGGDELFGGYRRYSIERFSPHYQLLPVFLREKIIKSMVNHLPRCRRLKRIVNTMGIKNPTIRYGSWLIYFADEMKKRLFDKILLPELEKYDSFRVYKKYYPLNRMPILDKIMYVDQKTWLPDDYLEKTDKAGMANGLEIRVPLLDRRLVEFAAAIPAKYKIHGLEKKYLLKKTVKNLLPKQILKKPKMGFATPLDPWFRKQLKNFLWEVLFDSKTLSRPYFNFKYIEELYRRHLQGKEVLDQHLWFLLVFELWHRQFID